MWSSSVSTWSWPFQVTRNTEALLCSSSEACIMLSKTQACWPRRTSTVHYFS